jgi:hypothetical protein
MYAQKSSKKLKPLNTSTMKSKLETTSGKGETKPEEKVTQQETAKNEVESKPKKEEVERKQEKANENHRSEVKEDDVIEENI